MIFFAWHAICDVHLFVVFYLSSFFVCFLVFFLYSWFCFFICLLFLLLLVLLFYLSFFLVLLGCCAATIPLVFILQPNTKKRRCSFTILFCIICFLPVFHRSKTVTNIQPLGYILQQTKIKACCISISAIPFAIWIFHWFLFCLILSSFVILVCCGQNSISLHTAAAHRTSRNFVPEPAN